MLAADPLFDLPTPADNGGVPVCWSYGMGAESTAGVVRSLLEPGFVPTELLEDLSNLIVMTAQTGDEWRSTCDLVTRFVLPLLAERGVRMVEVARAGPAVRDGIVVLQDNRQPIRLHPDPVKDGFFSLSRENRRNGVMPQLGGTRKCSIKAKGWPLDHWRAGELGSTPYLHAVGYNIDEGSRILTDSAVRLGGRRHPFYPIHEIGWTRTQCQQYLYDLFGVWWPKSCCRQCCFVSRDEWPDQLARFNTAPAEGAHHLIDEYMAVALNRHAGLFGRAGTLAARLERNGAVAVLALAEQELASTEWALYRVRRCYLAPAQARRSIEIAHRADRATEQRLLHHLADRLELEPVTEAGHTRLWLAHPTPDRYPHIESFYVAAPAEVRPKQRPGFEPRFARPRHRRAARTRPRRRRHPRGPLAVRPPIAYPRGHPDSTRDQKPHASPTAPVSHLDSQEPSRDCSLQSAKPQRNFNTEEIDALVQAAAELWAMSGTDADDKLSTRQKELIERARILHAGDDAAQTDAHQSDTGRVVFTVVHAAPVRFAIDEAALAEWIAADPDEAGEWLPTTQDDAPGSTLSNLVSNAELEGVFTGDPDLELQVNGDDDSDGSGFYVMLHNRYGRQRMVGLTTGWSEFYLPDKNLPLIDSIRDCLQQVVSAANGLLILITRQS